MRTCLGKFFQWVDGGMFRVGFRERVAARSGKVRETSPTGVGVRNFKESSGGKRSLQAVNVNESQ